LTKSKSVVYYLVGNFMLYALSKKLMTFFMILPVWGATDTESQHVFTPS